MIWWFLTANGTVCLYSRAIKCQSTLKYQKVIPFFFSDGWNTSKLDSYSQMPDT